MVECSGACRFVAALAVYVGVIGGAGLIFAMEACLGVRLGHAGVGMMELVPRARLVYPS